MSAGWEGLLAVEQDSLAFETLKHNLLGGNRHSSLRYTWPAWLNQVPLEISRFIADHEAALVALRGKVDLLAGGPPCQGFSLAGRRKRNDPRNKLFKHYVRLVTILKPPFLLLENVRGVSIAFRRIAKGKRKVGRKTKPFSERIKTSLQAAGYNVFTRLVRAVEMGVPQLRPRYILIAIRRDLLVNRPDFDPFGEFEKVRIAFLKQKGLSASHPVTVRQAISDLETTGTTLIECLDSAGFKQIEYGRPRTKYQRLLHEPMNGTAPNSLRLAKHKPQTRKKFRQIIASCRHGVQLSVEDRERFGLKKHCIVPLDANRPSHTLTTLPDDFLHYSEPRILTVREYARLQSFPDWYEFRGKYTTGGNRRLRECPRYTQAGNAVPPFMGELIGHLFADLKRALVDKP